MPVLELVRPGIEGVARHACRICTSRAVVGVPCVNLEPAFAPQYVATRYAPQVEWTIVRDLEPGDAPRDSV